MFFKNKRYEEEIDRLEKEVDRAHMRIAVLKESHLNLERRVIKLNHDLIQNKKEENKNTKEKLCYTITENNIVSSYEDPKYLIKHIQHCLDENVPFKLNDMAKNYWLNSLKNNEENEENKPADPKHTLGKPAKTTETCYQWR